MSRFTRKTECEASRPFCALPFLQLMLQPTGDISPCCWNQQVKLGSIENESLLQIWNNEKTAGLRQEFLSGNIVTCKTAIRHNGCNRMYAHLEHLVDRAVIQSMPPRRLDIRINGKCNLECVMCGTWKQPNALYDETDFWTRGPQEVFPYLVEIDMLGGEPFIQKDTYRLIDEISAVNPSCGWFFVTNAQWSFTRKIEAALDKISIRSILVSIDSLNPYTYSSIRKHGVLSKTLETFESLRKYGESRSRPFKLEVAMCAQKSNWREIESFIDFARERGVEFHTQFATTPADLSLLSLNRKERREILRYVQELYNRTGASTLLRIATPLEESLQTTWIKSSVRQVEQFMNRAATYLQRRIACSD